jgi:hypothetical protein
MQTLQLDQAIKYYLNTNDGSIVTNQQAHINRFSDDHLIELEQEDNFLIYEGETIAEITSDGTIHYNYDEISSII